MAKAYSLALRARVLKDCDAGIRSEDVAKKYSVSASWVYDLRKKRRETGIIALKQQRYGSKPKLKPYEQEVRQLVADHPDATLAEFCGERLPIRGRNSVEKWRKTREKA